MNCGSKQKEKDIDYHGDGRYSCPKCCGTGTFMTQKQIEKLQSESDTIIGKLMKKLDSKEMKALGRLIEIEYLLQAETNK